MCAPSNKCEKFAKNPFFGGGGLRSLKVIDVVVDLLHSGKLAVQHGVFSRSTKNRNKWTLGLNTAVQLDTCIFKKNRRLTQVLTQLLPSDAAWLYTASLALNHVVLSLYNKNE